MTAASVIKDRKLRFALVGCGRISDKHFEALQHNSNHAEWVAVCDTDSQALKAAEQKSKSPGYSDINQMITEKQPDVVVLATPSGIHSEHAIIAAKKGCHIVTEKPMATRWKDGLKMVQACDENNVRLFVVKQNRCNPTLCQLKNAIDQNRFGRIYLIDVNVFWSRPQSYYDSAEWRGTWEFDGGALMNQASHYIDLMEWLGGPVESVQALTATLARQIEVEDTAVLNLKYRAGTLGSASVTMLTYKQNFEGSLTILGDKGTVKIGGVALNEILHWDFETSDPADQKIKEANYKPSTVYGPGHTGYYQNVIQTLRGEASPLTDGREGLRSLEVLIASYLSARDGCRITLPLEF